MRTRGSTNGMKRVRKNFIAYHPDEPNNYTRHQLRTWSEAKRRARREYGWDVVVFEYKRLHDRSTWELVIGQT